MKVTALNTLCKTDYHIKFLDALKMPQKPTDPVFSCISVPKKQDLILYLKDCRTKYKTKDGKTIVTKPGQVVYIPEGSEYTVECTKSESEDSSTLQINFNIMTNEGKPCILSREILLFTPRGAEIETLFEKAELLNADINRFPTEQKTILYSILNTLAAESVKGKNYEILEPGMEYLHTNYHKNCSIAELAELCHISEEYFRKLFKKQTGKKPAEYRNTLRLQKAEQYLLHSDMPVAEISENLGYATVSHFIKQFKSFNGISPLSYRKKHRR